MAHGNIIFCTFVFTFFICVQLSESYPSARIIHRQKRISDQRLAELETLLALHKMKGKLVTVPVGFGRVDPTKLGRRRRSVQKLLRSLIDDESSESENNQSYSEEEEDVVEREKEAEEDTPILLLNLLYNEELRNRYRALPVRLPE